MFGSNGFIASSKIFFAGPNPIIFAWLNSEKCPCLVNSSSNHHWTAYGSKLSCHFLHNLQFFTVNPRKESILYPPQALTRNRSQRSSDRPKACWSQEMPTCLLRRRHKEGCKRDYRIYLSIPSHPIPFHPIPPSIYLSFYPSIQPSIIYLSIYPNAYG